MDDVIRGYWAGAKFNGDFFCIETRSGYRGGSELDYKGKQHLLPSDASDETLGIAVVDALAHSRFVLGAPRAGSSYPPNVEFDMELYDYNKSNERYAQWIKNLMARYGYKTKRALFKNMHSCSIKSCQGIMNFHPWHHERLEGWSRAKDDGIEDVIIPADSTPVEIGAALKLAFSRCIPVYDWQTEFESKAT